MELKYHQSTAELLTGMSSSASRAPVFALSEDSAYEIPAAVREWYRLEDAISILENFSNCDHPLEPAEFDCKIEKGTTIVRFMIENQGCAAWGFVLDGSDDPPVVVNQEPDWWHRPRWEYCTERFSDFVFLRVFDWQYFHRQDASSAEESDEYFGQSPRVKDQVAAGLNKHFQRVASSCDWPDISVTRFEDTREKRIIIQQGGNSATWLILASNRQKRRELSDAISSICQRSGFPFDPPHFA